MLESFYLTGWGGFAMMLFMLLPFLCAFLYVVFKKSLVDSSPSQADRSKYVRMEFMWVGFVILVFVGVNVGSIDFMHTVSSAKAATNATNIIDVDVSAQSWSYDISERTFEVGRPVRFSGRSMDTMHGFAVYHPDGKVLFTMMLMPGMTDPTSLIHTFSEPGTYTVRCLEYCGVSHHDMTDELIVVAGNS